MTDFLDEIGDLLEARLGDGCRLYHPYPKAKTFHALSATHRSRVLSGGNRTGKTFAGGMETAMHLTGLYPDWWTGHRFNRPITAWVGSQDWGTNVEGVQSRLVGDVARGMLGKATWDADAQQYIPTAIPADCIIGTKSSPSPVPNSLGEITVLHVPTQARSRVRFFSYESGRKRLQAGKVDFVWLDEEPPEEIATEVTARTLDTPDSLKIMTFTPLMGVSRVVRKLIGDVQVNNDFPEVLENAAGALIRVRAYDVPHLTEQMIERMKTEYPEHEHGPRIEGIPALGEGAIFPFPDDQISVDPFTPPTHWQVLDALDFGWTHPMARVRAYRDPDTQTIYIAQDYAQKQQSLAVHVGLWHQLFSGDVPVAWPQDGTNETAAGDGVSLKDQLRGLGVRMAAYPVRNPDGSRHVEVGLRLMYEMFVTGKLKVFRTCTHFFNEKAFYRREKRNNGLLQIVKENDDAIDAARYAVMGLLGGMGTPVWKAFEVTTRLGTIQRYGMRRGREMARDGEHGSYDWDVSADLFDGS